MPASRWKARCRITASWIEAYPSRRNRGGWRPPLARRLLRQPGQLEPFHIAQQLDEALGLKLRPLLALVGGGERSIAGGAGRVDVLRDPGMRVQAGRAQEFELVLHPH